MPRGVASTRQRSGSEIFEVDCDDVAATHYRDVRSARVVGYCNASGVRTHQDALNFEAARNVNNGDILRTEIGNDDELIVRGNGKKLWNCSNFNHLIDDKGSGTDSVNIRRVPIATLARVVGYGVPAIAIHLVVGNVRLGRVGRERNFDRRTLHDGRTHLDG